MPRTGTREQWHEERLALLEREKQLTRLGDEVARERQALPWVEITKEYVLDTPDGRRTLAELFDGRSQLVVYHFMLPPGADSVCASCSSIADGVNGPHVHLEHHDVMFTAISRAPLDEIEEYRARMGWSFRWASSHDSDFNFDYLVSSTEERPLPEYNFRAIAEEDRFVGERPGVSAFALEDGKVFHTYSAYERGVDAIWGVYQWLDRAPKGRNDDPYWHRRRYELEAAAA